jgi:hypothetical protein
VIAREEHASLPHTSGIGTVLGNVGDTGMRMMEFPVAGPPPVLD